jgi:hypothetical protein
MRRRPPRRRDRRSVRWTPDGEAPVDTEVFVADLVEPARVVTHEQLDEGYRAFTIATAWLRSKAASSAGVVVEPATL